MIIVTRFEVLRYSQLLTIFLSHLREFIDLDPHINLHCFATIELQITLVAPILRHSVRDHVEFAYVNIFVSQVLFVQHILDCALSVFAQILILTSCICSEIKSSICICLPCDICFGRNSTLGVISAYNSYFQGESPLMPGNNRWLVHSFSLPHSNHSVIVLFVWCPFSTGHFWWSWWFWVIHFSVCLLLVRSLWRSEHDVFEGFDNVVSTLCLVKYSSHRMLSSSYNGQNFRMTRFLRSSIYCVSCRMHLSCSYFGVIFAYFFAREPFSSSFMALFYLNVSSPWTSIFLEHLFFLDVFSSGNIVFLWNFLLIRELLSGHGLSSPSFFSILVMGCWPYYVMGSRTHFCGSFFS